MFQETLQKKLQDLVLEARKIHSQERYVLIDSLRVMAKLAYWRAELYIGGKHEHGTKTIGLTPDQYFKRLRVAKLTSCFPQAIEHLRGGKIQVTMDEGGTKRFTAAKQLDEGLMAISDDTVAEMSMTQDLSREERSLLPQSSQTPERGHSIRRKIPEALKRAVFRQAEGRCQHQMPDGSRCGATRMVET